MCLLTTYDDGGVGSVASALAGRGVCALRESEELRRGDVPNGSPELDRQCEHCNEEGVDQ